jgi:hypothetical protein
MIGDITVEQLLKIYSTLSGQVSQSIPFTVGAKYFIRTGTYHFTGRLKAIAGKFLVLSDAAWIADSGRFANALKTGEMNEIEPYPDRHDLFVNIDHISDATEVDFELPRKQI